MYSTDPSRRPLEDVTLRKLQTERQMPRNHSFGLICKISLKTTTKTQDRTFLDSDWPKPLSINIPSSRDAEVQLHWRRTPMKFNALLRCQLVALSAVKIEAAAAVWSFSECPQDLHPFQQN